MTTVDLNNLQLLETECMKVLTSKRDTYLSQFEVYNLVSEKLDLKDPIEKERLKYKILMILRCLSNVYDYVNIINKNNILYIGFMSDTNTNTNNDINKNIDINININKELDKQINNEKTIDMPTDISVINFILDNNITEFIYQNDYLGNNILHYLIMHNDLNRIDTHFSKLMTLLEKKNEKGQFPIELINDIKTSNYFLSLYYLKFQENQKDFLNIYVMLDELYASNINIKNRIAELKIINIIYLLIFFSYVLYNNMNSITIFFNEFLEY